MPTPHTQSLFDNDAVVGTAFKKHLSGYARNPMEWYVDHFEELLACTRDSPGLKVRVLHPLMSNINRILPSLLLLADEVVVSPPPLWACQYGALNGEPWPGFDDRSFGCGSLVFHGLIGDDKVALFDWLLKLKPLLERGWLTYLPRNEGPLSESTFRWNHPAIPLPELPPADLSTEEGLRRSILEDLLCEHAVSQHLGCIHVDATTARTPLLVPTLPGWTGPPDILASRVLVRLRIPDVGRVPLSDFIAVLDDEADSVRAFRGSVKKALREVERMDPDRANLSRVVAELQGDLVDAPFNALKRRLAASKRVRTKKHAIYAGAAVLGTVCLYAGEPMWAGAAFSGVAITTIMEKYYSDVERDIGLRSDALFWLHRLAQEAKK